MPCWHWLYCSSYVFILVHIPILTHFLTLDLKKVDVNLICNMQALILDEALSCGMQCISYQDFITKDSF
jgi:hypothetical protein